MVELQRVVWTRRTSWKSQVARGKWRVLLSWLVGILQVGNVLGERLLCVKVRIVSEVDKDDCFGMSHPQSPQSSKK